MDIVEDLPVGCRWLHFLDARSLGRASMVSRSFRDSVDEKLVDIGRDRRIGSSNENQLTKLLEMESALLWEPFQGGFRESWDGNLSSVSVDDCLKIEGGREMNFDGIRIDLTKRDSFRISFSFKVRFGLRRGFCNLFFSSKKKKPAQYFHLGDNDVFSILLPLYGRRPCECWLPAIPIPLSFNVYPRDDDWTDLDLHVKKIGDKGYYEVFGRNSGDDPDSQEVNRMRFPLHASAGFDHLYIFNWIEENRDSSSPTHQPSSDITRIEQQQACVYLSNLCIT